MASRLVAQQGGSMEGEVGMNVEDRPRESEVSGGIQVSVSYFPGRVSNT